MNNEYNDEYEKHHNNNRIEEDDFDNENIEDKINELEYKIEELERKLEEFLEFGEEFENKNIEKINKILSYEDKINYIIEEKLSNKSSNIPDKRMDNLEKKYEKIEEVIKNLMIARADINGDKKAIHESLNYSVNETKAKLDEILDKKSKEIENKSKTIKDELMEILNGLSNTSSNEETKISSDEIKEIANIVKISIDTNYKNEIKKEVSNLKEKKSITTKFIIPMFINIMVSICVLTSYNYFFNDIKIIKKK